MYRMFFLAMAALIIFAAAACQCRERHKSNMYCSAVPPVESLKWKYRRYIIDEPFPQWAREAAPAGASAKMTKCADASGVIPAWANPLPVSPVKCAAVNDAGTEMWAATENGLVYLDLESKRKLYFAGKRWLPDDNVISVGVTPGGDALARTAGGNAVIARRMMTMEEKALYFERVAQERHNRMGMVSSSVLATPGDISTNVLVDDDNDGQWTEMYLAAESFRYGATGDPEALKNARNSFKAMVRLLTVSPAKGFPARSVLPADKCPGRDPKNWRMLPSGDWCWKSDASVDELVGHYFGLPIYYDIAADDADREIIRGLIRDMTDRLIENGMKLADENGKVTTDGHLDPEWVNSHGKFGDQGLNSLDALSILRSAYHVTGDKKYISYYHKLIRENHYNINASREKEISDKFQENHDSDEMAFLSFFNLVRYEDDPNMNKEFYLKGLEQSWQTDLPERNPEQIMIYCALVGNECGFENGVRTLREIPLDLVAWSVRNSARADVVADQHLDRFGRKQSAAVLPYTETPALKWSENMYLLDDNAGGGGEIAPTFWLLPYWMARYYGYIRQQE